MGMELDALTDEVLHRCDVLGGISDEPNQLTRTYLSTATREAQGHLSHWMIEAGLAVRTDAVGNVVGRMGGGQKVFIVGSHIDTVPNAGKYDGILGVMLGIAAAKYLRDRSFAHRLEVVAFSEEEGVRFRFPYIGSLAICGQLTSEHLEKQDWDGRTVTGAIRVFGLNPEEVAKAAYPLGSVIGYLEAHIEQGPVLEAKNLPLGIVPAIMGQTRAMLTFTGMAGHAGTQPMELRRDALAAAAVFISTVEECGRATPGLRATVGSLTVSPNAGNVVPGEAILSLDVRHEYDAVRTASVEKLKAGAEEIGRTRGIGVTFQVSLDHPAVPCEPIMTARLATAMQAGGHSPEPVLSGAGHDAAVMAGICPVAMLFLRSPGGISHHPDESVSREDVRAALGVMVRFLESELQRHVY